MRVERRGLPMVLLALRCCVKNVLIHHSRADCVCFCSCCKAMKIYWQGRTLGYWADFSSFDSGRVTVRHGCGSHSNLSQRRVARFLGIFGLAMHRKWRVLAVHATGIRTSFVKKILPRSSSLVSGAFFLTRLLPSVACSVGVHISALVKTASHWLAWWVGSVCAVVCS
jgi:hypothetical protein